MPCARKALSAVSEINEWAAVRLAADSSDERALYFERFTFC